MIDDWRYQDNRQYEYSIHSTQQRAEYEPIVDWIAEGAKVVDFGCGDGSLLDLLTDRKSIVPLGYDVSSSGVSACQAKAIDAVCDRIDKKHSELADSSFDYAICNVTLQMVDYPELLIQEMIRVAPNQIISFPNFAYYKNRIDMAMYGRMPQPMLFGYQWFSTGHTHQLSIHDFHTLLKSYPSTAIKKSHHIGTKHFFLNPFLNTYPNLLSKISIFLLSRTA